MIIIISRQNIKPLAGFEIRNIKLDISDIRYSIGIQISDIAYYKVCSIWYTEHFIFERSLASQIALSLCDNL